MNKVYQIKIKINDSKDIIKWPYGKDIICISYSYSLGSPCKGYQSTWNNKGKKGRTYLLSFGSYIYKVIKTIRTYYPYPPEAGVNVVNATRSATSLWVATDRKTEGTSVSEWQRVGRDVAKGMWRGSGHCQGRPEGISKETRWRDNDRSLNLHLTLRDRLGWA